METIGFVIKRTARGPNDKPKFIKTLYHTVSTARMIATRFNGQRGFGGYEVFEVTGVKKVEK